MNKYVLKTAVLTLASVITVSMIGSTTFEASAAKKETIKKAVESTTELSKNKIVNKETGKAIKGFVSYKGKVYKDGSLFSGTVNSLKYISGKKANETIKGIKYVSGKKANTVIKGIKYIDGKKANEVVSGILYVNGVKYSGVKKGIFYKAGKKATGVAKDGKLYVSGKPNKGARYYNKKWYKDTALDTKKNKAMTDYLAIKPMKETSYTAKSWKAYEKVLKANKLTVSSTKVSTAKFVAATKAIKVAQGKLVKKVVKKVSTTALKSKIKEVKYIKTSTKKGSDIDSGEKWTTVEAKTALQKAVESANKVAANKKVSQKTVDQAVKTLTSAISTYKKAQKTGTKVYYAAVSAQFQEFADSKLENKKTASADYYYSAQLSEDFMNQYSNYVESSMTPYIEKMFPLVKTNKNKPTFVFLGNHKEQMTFEFSQLFYGSSIPAYGWFSGKHNITVMTHLGFEPPYNSINTILLPHEYFHWLNYNVYKSSIPGWLNEGIAYSMSWAMNRNTTNFLETSIYNQYKMKIKQAGTINVNAQDGSIVVTSYIQGKYGQEKLEKLLRRSSSVSFDQAFQEIYGKNVNTMVEEAKQYAIAN